MSDEKGFVWQKKPGDGQFPILESADIGGLKAACKQVIGRDDVRVTYHSCEVKDDHVKIQISMKVR
jgi:hypothetical protein